MQSPVIPASVFRQSWVVQPAFSELTVLAMQFCFESDLIKGSVSCSCLHWEVFSSDADTAPEHKNVKAKIVLMIKGCVVIKAASLL